MGKVLTAALAKIKLANSNTVVGKIRSVRCTENFRRGRVVGLGEITPSELPILEWTGTMNVGQYAIPLANGVWDAVDRGGTSVSEFVKKILFDEGIQVSIMYLRKKDDGTIEEKTFATVALAFLTSEGFDINESQISGRDATFEYTTPIMYGG
jgi:hypothetical protein